jgi:hypothetical protein
MRRGTILTTGFPAPELLPTFVEAGPVSLLILTLLWQYLQGLGFTIPEALHEFPFRLNHGDGLEGGRGEIFTR